MNKVKIKIENLYKIFGPKAKNFTEVVRSGVDKEELLAKYNHVLGLDNINLDQLINTVCMISPFSIEEKQKLIETSDINNKIKMLDEIISFSLFDYEENKTLQ